MKYFLTMIFSLCVFSLNLMGQMIENDIVIGKEINIQSRILNEDRSIQIYLPDGYQSSTDRKYPVMYVLDGQDYFMQPIVYQKMLKFRDKSPDFIVVGINSGRQKRRNLYYSDSGKFLDFLKKELIDFIDLNYRTLKEKERVYFGWEMAGGLGIEIFTKDPSLFSAFFIASPTHLTNKRLLEFDSTLNSQPGINTYFILSRAPEENFLEKSLNKVDSILKRAGSSKIEWSLDLYEGEDHYTTPTKTIHNGLSKYFSDFKSIRYYSLKDYDDFGGLDALRAYYKNRGERYLISTDVDPDIKHFLMLNSMKEGNLSRFEHYNKELGNYLETQLSRDFWVNRFARFYLEKDKKDEALNLFESGLLKFPESALIYNGMGDVYKAMSDKRQAKIVYLKAIELAKKNEDSNLMLFQKDLKEL